jgi:hypothetical protein
MTWHARKSGEGRGERRRAEHKANRTKEIIQLMGGNDGNEKDNEEQQEREARSEMDRWID